jgi:hypothetical protein
MNVVVMACGSPVKKKSPFWEERAIEGVHGCPLIFQIFLSELAPSARAVVVEVSQGRSLHLSG